LNSSLQLKHLVDIAWRRKWWIGVPIVLGTAASLALVAWVPKVYRAATTILVTRDGESDPIVRSTVTLRIEERMRSLKLQVFGRSSLEPVARKLGMIGDGASEADIEEICRTLRTRIVPEIDEHGFSWFRISADDVDPVRAAGIANQVAAQFIAQNTRIRTSQARGTLDTTASWEEAYRAEIAKGDEEISEFKRQNLYELPEQQPANAQFLSLAEDRALQLRNDIRARADQLAAWRLEQGVPRAAAEGSDQMRQATLDRELLELLGRYTDDNPLVKRKRAQIAEFARSNPPGAAPDSPGASRIAAQIETVKRETLRLERELAREDASIATYRARLRNAPLLQPRLLKLSRGYDQSLQQLGIAMVRKDKAEYSKDVEESQPGEQFQIQDRASPPKIPFKPDFGMFLLIGIGLGIALGVGSAAAREFVDQTVRCEDEFASHFPDLPVFGVIPSLEPSRLRANGVHRRIA